MRNIEELFKNRKIQYDKLIKYGFICKENTYTFKKNINDNNFQVIISISKSKKTSKVLDLVTNEEYVMVDIKDSNGKFIGRIKEEYEDILNDIIEKCSVSNIFKNKQTKEVIKYIKDKYNDDLEFLWKKFPTNAIWRNKINNKWYGLLLILEEKKLEIESDKLVDIIVLRYQKDKIESIVDNKKIFKGYHMNKKNWITLKLDDTIATKEIYKFIDNSYEISKQK